jgi:Tol biopolymer transport system component
MSKRKITIKKWLVLVLGLVLAFGAIPGMADIQAFAQIDGEKIAFVRSNDQTGDEIWLIDPEGTNERRIWHTSVPGAEGIQDVNSLTWSPDGRELAFASRHEAGCSFFGRDIYTIREDGSGYRRVTAPPACAQRAGLPKGTVVVSLFNWSATAGPFTVYFQGAEAPKEMVLPTGVTTTVTFENVADYGDKLQWAVAIFGGLRFHDVLANVDVIPGQVVETRGVLPIMGAVEGWGFHTPTWRSDGTQIAYIFGASGAIFGLPANNQVPGEIGVELIQPDLSEKPGDPKLLSYAPVAARANQLLYEAYDFHGEGATIFLVEEGAGSHGQAVLAVGEDIGRAVLGLAWLPDGSGFLYSATEDFNEIANMYVYRFATETSTRLTNFSSGFTREMSISPDGERVVFEHQYAGEWTDGDPPIDLWMMNIDGDELSPFLEDAHSPAWGKQAASLAPAFNLFVPLIIR